MIKRIQIILLATWLGHTATAAQPNVVVIISDDAGFADWGFMDAYTQSVNPGQAASAVPTPNLDTLRERGVLFTQGYTAAVCSPSRAAIVTGSYQQRIGYEFNINNKRGATAIDGLHPSTTTIFHRMKAEGYTTGAIGKWHIGARANDAGLGNRPENMDVDEFFGIWKGSRGYGIGGASGAGALRETIANPFSDTVLETTAPWNTTTNYVTTAFGQGAIDFIDRHYNDANPFFLYVAFTAPHIPIGNSPDIDDPRIAALSGTRKQYASMVLTMDKEIGRIIDKIADPAGDGSTNLIDNTLVIFLNDNGGAASRHGTLNTPLREGKGHTYEGGTRVPMIIAGPGVPANTNAPITFSHPIHSIDILPTCVEAAGGSPIAGIDGVNLIPFINGSNTNAPHEFITIRQNNSRVGVRKGDWKLVKDDDDSVPFELYNLATDISETNNLAGTHPAIMAELLREFTAFEAGCEKPRHARLYHADDSINFNNKFKLKPVSSGGGSPVSTSTNVVRNAGFESGDGSGNRTFAELHDWSNNGVENTSVGASSGDSHSGTYRGVVSVTPRTPFQLTDHPIAGGETMLLDFWHKGFAKWDSVDTIDVELFYLAGSTTQVLARANVNPTSAGWARSTHLFPAIADPSAIGKNLGIRFISKGASSEFAGIDDIFLSTATSTAGTTTVAMDWSATNAWIDTDTSADDTLLAFDAYAGAIFEFPTTDDFSYSASNDMRRRTDLEFMLNTMQLSGTFTGEAPQSATINGNELLFTDDLTNRPATIDIAATGTGFSFVIENDLILFDDLSIIGNGDAAVELAGSISDYFDPRGVNKSGNSTVVLSGTNSYSGNTTISGGSLLLGAGASLPNTDVAVESGGTLGGSGLIGGSVSVKGILATTINGGPSNLISIAGTLDLQGATLSFSETGSRATEPAYVLATYGVLTRPFTTVTNLPAGYRLEYAYDDGISLNNIAIVTNGTPEHYDTWISDSGQAGTNAAFSADANADGLANGLAYFLGALDANENTGFVKPDIAITNGNLVYTFERAKKAVGEDYRVEYRNNLALGNWISAELGFNDVTITTVDNGTTDQIVVTLPAALADEAAALFARLVLER